MPKKPQAEGAPAYMGLYATLMIVMLAFFILLTTMSPTQSAGFKAGIGEVRNAFGMAGGFGLFSFATFGNARSHARVPKEHQSDSGVTGLDMKMLMSATGGSGQSDQDVQKKKLGTYARVLVPFEFNQGSYVIPIDLAKYLRATGTGLVLFQAPITVRCYAGDTGDYDRDRELASKRAAVIVRYLTQACGMPPGRMQAIGYSNQRYLREPGQSEPAPNKRQAIYLYVFRLGTAENDATAPAESGRNTTTKGT